MFYFILLNTLQKILKSIEYVSWYEIKFFLKLYPHPTIYKLFNNIKNSIEWKYK